jgi:hypothetical protein
LEGLSSSDEWLGTTYDERTDHEMVGVNVVKYRNDNSSVGKRDRQV